MSHLCIYKDTNVFFIRLRNKWKEINTAKAKETTNSVGSRSTSSDPAIKLFSLGKVTGSERFKDFTRSTRGKAEAEDGSRTLERNIRLCGRNPVSIIASGRVSSWAKWVREWEKKRVPSTRKQEETLGLLFLFFYIYIYINQGVEPSFKTATALP